MQRKSYFLLIDWLFLLVGAAAVAESIQIFNQFDENANQYPVFLGFLLLLLGSVIIVDEVFFLFYAYSRKVSLMNGLIATVGYIIGWILSLISLAALIYGKIEYENLFADDFSWGKPKGKEVSRLVLTTFIFIFLKYFDVWFWVIVKVPFFLYSYTRYKERSTFKFMTYNLCRGKNIHGDVGFYQQFDYIKKVNPDVLFIQEGENLHYGSFVQDGLTIIPPSNIDRHTLILTHGEVLLSEKIYFKTQDSSLDRTQYFMVAQLKVRHNIFWVLNTHLTANLKMDVAIRQIDEIADHINKIEGNEPIIFAGDFNLTPSTHAIRLLNYTFKNSWALSSWQLFGYSAFCGTYVNPFFPYYVKCDYIFSNYIKNSLAYSYVGEGFLSDHKPVISTFELDSNPSANESIETVNLNASDNPML